MSLAFVCPVLGKYEGQYWNCNSCGYMKVKEPTWLAEAYEQTITSADVGLLRRNIAYSEKIAVIIDEYLNLDDVFLDYAGGYGVFSRLMRDAGFKFLHDDPYTENIFAKEYEFDGYKGSIGGLTCFECLEHFVNPFAELEKIFKISRNVIFSTVLKPDLVPELNWDYYGFEHGQHVSFYSSRALQEIGRRFGLRVFSAGNLHFFTEQPISQAKFTRLVRGASKKPHLFAKRTRFATLSRKLSKRRSSVK